MKKSEIARFLILRSIGNFLVLFALYGVSATFGPALYFEVNFRLNQLQGVHYIVASAKTTPPSVDKTQPANPTTQQGGQFSAIAANDKEKILIPIDTQFGILIPKIGANAPVIANVDPNNEDEYLPALQKGVAHAKGTVFPGMKGNIYLFAHSTDNFWDVGRYNAVFYLLKDLTVGDDIVVFFEGLRHNYKVTESNIVDPTDVNYLLTSHQSDSEKLILQTCWPPGTAWKRLLVVAVPK